MTTASLDSQQMLVGLKLPTVLTYLRKLGSQLSVAQLENYGQLGTSSLLPELSTTQS